MTAVIMQPTYLPWVGYFDLIDQSDVFVLLDTVAFSRQSWQQRNRIKTPGGVRWLTVPVAQSLGQRIVDVEIDRRAPWRRKHWGTIRASYARAPYWEEYAASIQEIYDREWTSLAELNVCLIRALASLLGAETRFARTSELRRFDVDRVGLLAALCEEFGADRYLSPPGSAAYLHSDRVFQNRGIRLEFQTYAHPTYPQLHGEFVPYLSVLDLLFNRGPNALATLRSGRGRPRSITEMGASGPRAEAVGDTSDV